MPATTRAPHRAIQRGMAANCRARPVSRTASISAAPTPSGFDANA
jgi:hypothetical protein